MGGLAEGDVSRIAVNKASNEAVRTFARRMVQDHSQANSQLADLARQSGIAMPTEVAPEHKAMRSHLEGLGGTSFDLAYLHGQLVEHQKTAQLLEWEMGSGQDPRLVRFASSTLPVVLEHLETVQELLAQTSGAAAPGAAAAAR